MKEDWRPIPDWPYEASSLGRIRRSEPGGSPAAVVGHVLSPAPQPGGYNFLMLHDMPRRWPVTVHRLVALAFFGPPHEGQEVNHKNGIRNDDRIQNLEYVSHLENIAHARNNGRMAWALTDEQRDDIRGLAQTGLFDARDLAEIYDMKPSSIARYCDRNTTWAWATLARAEARVLRFYYRVLEAA